MARTKPPSKPAGDPSSSRSGRPNRSSSRAPPQSTALIPAPPPGNQPGYYPLTNALSFDDAEHQQRLDDILSTKKVMPTLIPCIKTLADLKLDILPQCRRMFIASGLDILFANRLKSTYPMLVKEFLSTFEIVGSPLKVTHWKFRIGSRYYTMSKAEVCEALGFPLEGFCGEYSVDERYEFWKLISTFDYHFRSGWSAAGIKEPVWKIIHRLVAMNINTRLEGATVISNPDLDIMISMSKGVPVDFFQILSGMMTAWATSLGNKAMGGGFFISVIAESQGWDLSSLYGTEARLLLDMDRIFSYKFIGKDGQWTHNPELPSGAKRRRIDRAQARVASPPREPAPVEEDQPPHDDVYMDEAHSPPAARHISSPPPPYPSAGQFPLTLEERFARLETSQQQIIATQHEFRDDLRAIMAYQRRILATSVSHNQLRYDFAEFRAQTLRDRDWEQDALSTLIAHAELDFPPPPRAPRSRNDHEAGPSRGAEHSTGSTAELFGIDDAPGDGTA